jgi:hypothetical protein
VKTPARRSRVANRACRSPAVPARRSSPRKATKVAPAATRISDAQAKYLSSENSVTRLVWPITVNPPAATQAMAAAIAT